MKVHLDQDRCVSSGQCVSTAPDVFDQRDDDGVAILLIEDATGETIERVRHAAMVCPALAISLEQPSDSR